jgi:hypothetical protein
MSKATLTRAAILGNTNLRSERVEVPEWGGAVNVRELTGSERDTFEASIVDLQTGAVSDNAENVRAKLVARTVIDDAGERLFTSDDVVELGKLSAAGLSRVYNVAARLSGITAEDLEELEGN